MVFVECPNGFLIESVVEEGEFIDATVPESGHTALVLPTPREFRPDSHRLDGGRGQSGGGGFGNFDAVAIESKRLAVRDGFVEVSELEVYVYVRS